MLKKFLAILFSFLSMHSAAAKINQAEVLALAALQGTCTKIAQEQKDIHTRTAHLKKTLCSLGKFIFTIGIAEGPCENDYNQYTNFWALMDAYDTLKNIHRVIKNPQPKASPVLLEQKAAQEKLELSLEERVKLAKQAFEHKQQAPAPTQATTISQENTNKSDAKTAPPLSVSDQELATIKNTILPELERVVALAIAAHLTPIVGNLQTASNIAIRSALKTILSLIRFAQWHLDTKPKSTSRRLVSVAIALHVIDAAYTFLYTESSFRRSLSDRQNHENFINEVEAHANQEGGQQLAQQPAQNIVPGYIVTTGEGGALQVCKLAAGEPADASMQIIGGPTSCPICMDDNNIQNRKKFVVFNCCHGCCATCAARLDSCHLCRAAIQTRRTYNILR